MARVFNGSSQYLSVSSTLLSNEPIDMVVHGNSDSVTAGQFAISLGNNGANGGYALAFRGDVASDPFQAWKFDDAGAGGSGATSAGFSATTWYVASNSFISNTSRAVFLNGGSKGTDTTNTPDPTPDYVTIGALRRNALSLYFDGSLAEAYLLDANMADAVHAVVGLGYSPIWLMPISNIRGWYPLQADNNNRVTGGYPDLTATGSPTDGVHPFNVVYPRVNGVITL